MRWRVALLCWLMPGLAMAQDKPEDVLAASATLAATYDVAGPAALVSKSKTFETVIGDPASRDTHLQPQIGINRWNGESTFSLKLLDADIDQPTVSVDQKAVVWTKARTQTALYDLGLDEETGGFEIKVTLLSPPDTNVLTFAMQSQGLQFYYQPPFANVEANGDTWELNPAGLPNKKRPANVAGSYAVYSTSSAGDFTALGGVNRKTGKAFHLYRPWSEDANGVRVWDDLKVDVPNGLLTITIPQAFLDTAVYPVVVDPTFGYTAHGASTDANANVPCYFFAATTPASNGTLTAITAYVRKQVANTTLDVALYSNSAGTANARLVAVEPGTAVTSATYSEIAVAASVSVTSGTQYWLAMREDLNNGLEYAFDTGSGLNGGNTFQYDGTVGAFPATARNTLLLDEEASIYGTYTASGGGCVPTLTLLGAGPC